MVCLTLPVWAEGGAGGAKAAKTPSVKLPGPAFVALETITPEHIRWHVRYLSHDLLEGRGTGQRGGDIAAEYIATQFAEYGLKPAGDHGTYMQKVPLVGITTLPETQFSLVPKKGEAMNLKPLDEYVAFDQTQQPESDVDADIVFVGYGIEAPEYNWDDYKGLDVRGKVLLMLVNEPPSDDLKFFKGKALTYYGRWTYKYEEAARKGAVGVILVHQTQMASYPWEVVRNSNSGERSALKLEGPALKVASWVHFDVATRLASASGTTLDKMMKDAQSRDFHPVDLGAKLKAHMVSKVRNFESNNVVAILPGSDPQVGRRGGDLHRALRSFRHPSRHARRQHFQRRSRQRHRLRHSDRTGAGFRHGSGYGRTDQSCSPRSRPRSRDCWARSIWANIRQFPPERSLWI